MRIKSTCSTFLCLCYNLPTGTTSRQALTEDSMFDRISQYMLHLQSLKGYDGIDIGTMKLFLLLYADDMTIFSETAEGLQVGLDILEKYCDRWKLTVNTEKTKIMVFRKGGILPRNLKFYYKTNELEIVRSFSYLGIVFTTGGSFSCAQTTLAGQAQKANYKLNSYLYKFSDISPKHVLDLYDKLAFVI